MLTSKEAIYLFTACQYLLGTQETLQGWIKIPHKSRKEWLNNAGFDSQILDSACKAVESSKDKSLKDIARLILNGQEPENTTACKEMSMQYLAEINSASGGGRGSQKNAIINSLLESRKHNELLNEINQLQPNNKENELNKNKYSNYEHTKAKTLSTELEPTFHQVA